MSLVLDNRWEALEQLRQLLDPGHQIVVLTGLAVQVLVNPLKLLDKLVEALLEFFERLLPVGR
ncbi:MAG: hypothetical protein ACYS74_17055, partial [Planctomycetota bacterium]